MGRRDRLSHDHATLLITSWLRFPVQEATVGIMQAALATAARFRISYWDAAIVEAARTLGSGVVPSEDLGDGQDSGGVQVDKPFGSGRRPRRSRGGPTTPRTP